MDKKEELVRQRYSLLRQIEGLLEGPMVFLGFVWLGILLVELVWGVTSALEIGTLAIWIVFIIDFAIKLFLAPHKWAFLKKNWLTILSLLVPALRVFRMLRVFRVARGLRSIRLVKVVGSLNRSMRSLSATMQRRGLKYVVLLTLVVTFGGAAGIYAFERETGLATYGDALWWTAMLVITMGSGYWPETGEGQLLCLLLSVYGFCVFGYITATLASFFVGRDAEEKGGPVAGAADIAALRAEIRQLTQAVQDLKGEGKKESP